MQTSQQLKYKGIKNWFKAQVFKSDKTGFE